MPLRARLPYWREVAVGGAIGTLARVLLDAVVGPISGWDPGIAVVNVIGALALGWLSTLALSGEDPARWRAFAGTGILGAFTTFSALALGVVDGSPTGPAVATLSVSIAGGILAAAVGHRVGATR